MTRLFRGLSVVCFVAALAAVAALLVSDAWNGLRLTSLHLHTGALALMLIGASYISLQLNAKIRPGEMLKGVLLGLAFVLWGSEQLLPAGTWVTAMDSAVITIFVVDLSLIILERLRRKGRG